MSDSSDEDQNSPGEQSSGEEDTESEQGSESSSGADERGSDSDNPSSGSASGTSSASGEDSDSSADDSDAGSHEEETDEDDEKTKAANKRKDFEKMKEISAHMDNIFQRFETLFNFHESRGGQTPLPELPPLPLPLPLPQPEPVKESRDRSVSARPMTMDRAVSARRLTTGRAVSVASGSHIDDELSGSVGSSTKREESTKHHRRERRRTTAHRRSGDRDREVGKNGAHNRTGTKKRHLERRTAQRGSVRTESSSEHDIVNERDPRAQPGSGKMGGGWQGQVPRDSRIRGLGTHGWHERLLWDELRDSLADGAGCERGMPGKWSRDGGDRDVVEQYMGDRANKEQQRRLIDEAIAVLLEGSSSDEGGMETTY